MKDAAKLIETHLKYKDFRAAYAICERLVENGYDAFLVGGCVRDMLMGVRPKDYDITTSALPQQVMALFPKSLAVGVQFGVVKVRMYGYLFEVATFRGEAGYYDGRHPGRVWFSTLEQDLLRRDFTMNALVMDPLKQQVIDKVGGMDAIAQGVIRAIGDPGERFREDKLRMLRAVRFAAQLGFAIEQGTLEAIRSMAPGIKQVSRERIREELEKLFATKTPEKGMALAWDTGLLRNVLPEITVYGKKRMLDVVGCMPRLGDATSRWSMLLHDLGPEGALGVMRGLRHSNQQSDRVRNTIALLLDLAKFGTLRLCDQKRVVRDECFGYALGLADDCGKVLGVPASEARHARRLFEVSDTPDLFPKPLLTGEDLKAMGYHPGPAFAHVIKALEDAQLEGAIKTRQEAEALVRRLMDTYEQRVK